MFGHHHHHHGHGGHQAPPPPPHEQTLFRIFCRADEAYCLTVRNDAVVLAPTNPRDEFQHWYKDMRHSTRVKDAEGQPAFALVNRATGLAIKHSLGQSHPVKLVPYNPDFLDESVLWTESHDVGKGFRCIRMVNNIHLNFDAFHGDKDHGGVHDGTTVVLWEWAKGPNQSWKVLPWGDEAYAPRPPGPYPPPAQPEAGYGGGYRPPPGGPAAGGYAPPPPVQEPGYGYRPAPPQEPGYGGYPPAPGNPAPGYGPPGYGNLPRALASEPTVRVFCKAGDGYSLTVRNGTVCLAPTNPRDEFQHWVKDMRHSTRIKDEEGYPAFALVNKVTGEAIKHSLGQSHPVRLVPYNPEYVDESVLWTESRDVGHGFRCVRMVNNIYLNFDAFHGDKDHGGVHDGTTVVLWEWAKGDNQRWKILPWCDVAIDFVPDAEPEYEEVIEEYEEEVLVDGVPEAPADFFADPVQNQDSSSTGTGEKGEDVVVRAPPPQPAGSPGVGPQPGVQDLLPRQRELLPGRPRRRRGAGPDQPQGRAPALVQGHALQHPGEGRGRHAGVRARQQGHGARHQALPRPVPPGEARSFQPGAGGRVGAVDGEQGRGQGLPLHPHGQQHPPQFRRLPRRQGPRRRARRHHRRPLGVVQGREPELEDPAVGPRGERRGGGPRRRRAHRARLLQGRRRGLQPDGAQRDGVPGAHQPAGRVPALDQGHAAQHPGAGRGRVPGLRAGQQGHRRGAQALHGAGPPREAGALQPGVPGRVGALDGEPRRRQRLPLRPHGQQHLPQLRRLPRRQGTRRRPRRHRDRALEVVRGRQPALEDPPMVDEGHRRKERSH